MSEKQKIVVLTTAGSGRNAKAIANRLLAERLAACVNILEGIQSIYRWKGEVCDEKEYLLIIKTRIDIFDKLAIAISDEHEYDCPEIIALPIVEGWEAYLNWIDACLE